MSSIMYAKKKRVFYFKLKTKIFSCPGLFQACQIQIMKPSCAKCTNFTVFLSLLFLYHATILSHFLLISLFFVLLVLSCVCLLLSRFLLFFSLPSPLMWCSLGLLLSSLLISLPVPSFFLHQIFKLFLVYTSLTPMPHCRLMAPTVGFSPPLRVTLTFLTPTSAYITPLFSVCPVFVCCVPFLCHF